MIVDLLWLLVIFFIQQQYPTIKLAIQKNTSNRTIYEPLIITIFLTFVTRKWWEFSSAKQECQTHCWDPVLKGETATGPRSNFYWFKSAIFPGNGIPDQTPPVSIILNWRHQHHHSRIYKDKPTTIRLYFLEARRSFHEICYLPFHFNSENIPYDCIRSPSKYYSVAQLHLKNVFLGIFRKESSYGPDKRIIP